MRWLAYAVTALVTIAVTLAVVAPAQWLAHAVESATAGRIELAEARGTVWNGSAVVVLAAGEDAQAPRTSLPENLRWQLSPWRLFAGTMHLQLAHPSALAQPLLIDKRWGGPLQIGPAQIRLPAALLAGLGAPWNTIRPGGVLTVAWNSLVIDGARATGNVSGEWQFASSILTPVSPFGHYRLDMSGGFPGTRLTLVTLSGPLELQGNGTIAERGRVRFQGVARPVASADATTRTQLSGLISLLGRRDGDTAILNIGN
jgi:general secretion pathway protein N